MKRTFFVLGLIAFIITTAAFTYDPPKYKNLKILPKDISKESMDTVMHHFSIALGQKCGFCHVHNDQNKTWDMASDTKPEKLIARKMMTMTNAINTKYFPPEDGTKDERLIQTVTCYTCHKGEAMPLDFPEV